MVNVKFNALIRRVIGRNARVLKQLEQRRQGIIENGIRNRVLGKNFVVTKSRVFEGNCFIKQNNFNGFNALGALLGGFLRRGA